MTAIASEPRGIHRRLIVNVTPSLIARLEAKTVRTTGCWEWTGCQRQGYGGIKHQGKVLQTHVVSFVIHNGQVPPGRLVTHSCDNRLCVNPAHLEVGTPLSNVLECRERIAVNDCHGDKSPNAKLTREQVTLARSLKLACNYGSQRIARIMGVHFPAVRHSIAIVAEKQSWKNLPWSTMNEARICIRTAMDSGLIPESWKEDVTRRLLIDWDKQ